MYKIKTKTETILTEDLSYIRRQPNGCLVLTEKENAEGVSLEVFDGGHGLIQAEKAQTDTEQALVEEDTMLDQRLSEIEMALVELDRAQKGEL